MNSDFCNEYADKIARLHVLVVEDDPINQEILQEVFEALGARVTTAADGQDAVTKVCAGTSSFDVILMDVQMPIMSGIEATRRIRADNRFADLPILGMAAAMFPQEIQQCLDAGMNAHIGKPYEIEHVMDTVVLWTKNNTHTVSAAAPSPPQTSLEEPEATRDSAAALPCLDGLDAQAGLQRSNGNRQLYFRLLRDFIDDSRNKWQMLLTALHADERATAINITHALKGVGGNLGFVRLHALAADLEASLRAAADAEAGLALFKNALEQVWHALPAQIGADSAPAQTIPPVDALDTHAALAVWAQLKSYVDGYDGLAADYLQEHKAVFTHWMSEAAMDTLYRSLTRYDFTDAARVLADDVLLRFAHENPPSFR